jgi:tetratricopeptide (TPR) repeat protein
LTRRTLRSLAILVPLAVAGLATLTRADLTAPLPRAVQAQLDLVASEPGNAAAQNDLGNLYVANGQLDEAAAAFAKAIALDPRQAVPRFNLALLELKRGKKLAALQQLDEVIERDPTHAWAYYQRGAIYESWGFRSRAIKAYAKAFALDRRLSFPEINPAVVENRLLAESLLEANAEPELSLQVPPRYEDPARIVALLLDLPTRQVATSPGAAPSAAAATRPGTGVVSASGGPGGGSARMVGGGSAGAGDRPGGANVREVGGTEVRSWVAGEEDDIGTQPPPAGGGVPVIVRPPIYSTGRLELELGPLTPSAPRAG